jgi:hypothetical protein
MKRPEKINGGYQPSSLHHGEGTPKPPKGGTGKTKPKHTFPTWEEFQEWSPFVHQDTKVIYDYFRNRMTITEFPKVGEQYEFQHLPEQGWYRKKLLGFKTTDSPLIWQSIRPIQPDPKHTLIERLRAVEKWYGIREEHRPFDSDEARIVIAEAIKLLEESK